MGQLVDASRRAVRTFGALVVLGAAGSGAGAAPTEADGAPPDRAGDLRPGPSPLLPALEPAEPPTLRLLWFDPTRALSPRATEVVAQEVRTIFQALGVDVAFNRAAPDATYGGADATLEIPLILLQDDPIPARRAQHVMGLVVRDQQPTRAVWAFLHPIRWTLGHEGRASFPIAPGEERGVGLALGRVVAHEVIHAVAPDEPHARNGLMNHSLDRAFLLGKRASLDVRCARAFLDQLEALQVPGPGALPTSILATAAR